MAKVTYEDLIDGNSGTNILRKGWTFVRMYKVSGLTGDGFAKVKSAYNEPDIPKLGDTHPDEPSVIVKETNIVSVASDTVEIAVKYAAPDLLQPSTTSVIIEVGSTLSQVDTNIDVNGNILQTQYTYPLLYAETPEFAGKTINHAGMVPRLIPEPTLRLTRLEDESPLIKSSIYVGKINSQIFEDGAPGTWMCTGIEGNSQDSGFTYTVTYSFQFRPDGWGQQIVFISSDTGEPPVFANPTEFNLGVRSYQIYEAIDFNQLDL